MVKIRLPSCISCAPGATRLSIHCTCRRRPCDRFIPRISNALAGLGVEYHVRSIGPLVLPLLVLTACGSSGPTAQAVVDDFAAAGLAVPNARDNSAQNCSSLGCTQLITTEALSVVQFHDPATAQRYADAFGEDAHLDGSIVLQYAAGRTPADARPTYGNAAAEVPRPVVARQPGD